MENNQIRTKNGTSAYRRLKIMMLNNLPITTVTIDWISPILVGEGKHHFKSMKNEERTVSYSRE